MNSDKFLKFKAMKHPGGENTAMQDTINWNCLPFYSFSDADDLAFLMIHLQPIAPYWKDLGLQLGINFGQLNVIEATQLHIPGGPAAFLQEMLFKYLNFAPPSHPHPTLEKLCEALRSPTIMQDRVAFDLEQEYQARSTGL